MTSHQPLAVTIVTPSYNQGRFIRATIESVLTQSYRNITYWVLDSGSTDETLAILPEYQNDLRFHWISEPDDGQAHAICKGFVLGRGDIIAWLNSDDIYEPGAIANAVELFHHNQNAVMVSGGVQIIDETGIVEGNIQASALKLEQLLRLRDFIPQPGVFIRREAFLKAGGIREDLQYAFDLDLFLRLLQLGEMVTSRVVLASHRMHRSSKSVAYSPQMRREAAQVVRRFLRTGAIGDLERWKLSSHAHLVEAYAAYALEDWTAFLGHMLVGLVQFPFNGVEIFQRANRHFREASPIL